MFENEYLSGLDYYIMNSDQVMYEVIDYIQKHFWTGIKDDPNNILNEVLYQLHYNISDLTDLDKQKIINFIISYFDL